MARSSPLLSSRALIAARRLLLLVVAMVVLLANAALAQTQRILHVWVDPHYGDNSIAVAWNPNPTPGSYQCSGNDTHPHNVFAGSVPPVLVHASAPFKTVTSAITYIRAIHPNGLPHHNVATGIDTVGVVIHCLPGIYGPASATAEPYSGLSFNGETFPIHLPECVSIQGTSGLNTVFLSNGATGVFEFGTAQNVFSTEDPGAQAHQFLANIAITGAIRPAGEGTYTGRAWQGSGIYVADGRPARLLIAQCFLYANATGLLVHSPTAPWWDPTSDPDTPPFHIVTVINNTFAWNVVGIWNGQYDQTRPPRNPTRVSVPPGSAS